MARVLVTGGSGFLGRAIVKELERTGGHEIYIWDIVEPEFATRAKYVPVDLLAVLPKQPAFDYIFHCPAILGAETTFKRIVDTERVNVLGTLAMLNLAGQYSVIIRPGLHNKSWLNPYMISTKAAAKYGLMYRKYLGAKFISCRFTIVYGPGQANGLVQNKAVPSFLNLALKNEPIVIYGDGSYKVRLLYVTDAVKLLISLAENYDRVMPQVTATSICNENYLTVNNLVAKVINITGSSSTVIYKSMRKGQPRGAPDAGSKVNDSVELYKELGFTESTSLDEGLCNTAAWMKALINNQKGT